MNLIKFLTNFVFVLFGFGPDVVTVTLGTAGNAGSTAAELITYMSARLLEVAEFNTILDQFGDKHPLPSNSSKTIRFVREEKLTVAATPTQLTEGIPPDAVGLTLNQIEATVEQYGSVVRLSDLSEITARHNVIERTIYVLGLQAAETYDQLIFNVLNAATNTYYPNNRAGDTNLLGSDLVGYRPESVAWCDDRFRRYMRILLFVSHRQPLAFPLRVRIAQRGQMGGPRARVQILQHSIVAFFRLHLRYTAIRVVDVTENDGLRGTTGLARGLDFTVLDPSVLLFGVHLGGVDSLDAIRAFLHHAAAAH